MSDSYIKDPEATLDYTVDWSAWLGDDTITGSTWDVPSGIEQPSGKPAHHDDAKATIWLEGGTPGETYKVTNRITTAAGRIDDRSIRIVVRQR